MSESDARGNEAGPIKHPAADERRASADAASAGPAPRIALAEALRNKWLEIWYQPKIDLRRKYLTGAEAMPRIRHPQIGMLPGHFVPEVDEQSIADLTTHTLLSSLSDWAMFEEAGFNLRLAVNVPVSVVLKLPISRLVTQNRPHSKRWPGLILEVKADHLARDSGLAKQMATQFRVSGIAVAIDDFGAGYCSFASLRDLPFAELKIDRSLVNDCANDPANAAICQTAIDLAHRFGSVVVAAGVEKAADMQALVSMGCDFGQGPLVGASMPKARFLELLRQRMSKPASPAANEAARVAPVAAPAPAGRVA